MSITNKLIALAFAVALISPAFGDGIGNSGVSTIAGMSDVTAPTAWAPSDVSGASLSLTNNGSYYYKVGKLCIVTVDVTYPSESNGSAAILGSLPCAPNSNVNAGDFAGVVFSAAASNFFYGMNTSSVSLYSNLNFTAVLNSTLSTIRIRFRMTYFTS